MTFRLVALLCAASLMAACSGRMGGQTALPSVVPDSTAASRAALAKTPGEGSLTVRVKTAHPAKSPKYVSPSTQALSIAITGPTKLKEIVGLSAGAKGCQSSVTDPNCSLVIAGLANCPTTKNCYSASVVAYDKYDAGSNTIPPGARKLSAALNVAFSIQSGNTLIPLVLQGIVSTIAVIPGPDTTLTGSQQTGFVFPKCFLGKETVSVLALDADRNYILGPGAPAIAVVSANPAQLSVPKAKPDSPNTFELTPPKAPAYAYGNELVKLTVTATPGAGSGATPKSATVDVTYSGDICGKFTEFPIPTTASHPAGIAGGPDGNLWFTEDTGNKIGRITPAGSITEFPVPSAGAGPYGIAAGPDGNLWFAESSISKIGKITTAGSAVEYPTLTAAAAPVDLAAGPDGNMWFTEDAADQIGRVTTGGIVSEFPVLTAASDPFGITAGSDGNLWFTESEKGNIGRISTTGIVSEFPASSTSGEPTDITTGPDGSLWFAQCQANSIARMTTAGTLTSQFALPDLTPSYPAFITDGPDGAVWFAEAGVNKIGRVTTGGAFTEFEIPTVGAEPFHLTTGPDGAIWFVEEAANNVGRLR
jgi:streptogramin lyase